MSLGVTALTIFSHMTNRRSFADRLNAFIPYENITDKLTKAKGNDPCGIAEQATGGKDRLQRNRLARPMASRKHDKDRPTLETRVATPFNHLEKFTTLGHSTAKLRAAKLKVDVLQNLAAMKFYFTPVSIIRSPAPALTLVYSLIFGRFCSHTEKYASQKTKTGLRKCIRDPLLNWYYAQAS